MEENKNLYAPISILAIMLIAAALIVVFQRAEREYASEAETASECSTADEAEIISVEVSELISRISSHREEVSSIIEAAEAAVTTEPFKSLSKPFNETATVKPETELDIEDDDFEYQNDERGTYIGYFTLTAYEWTGEPMANGEYPYYGAVACNSMPLGTWIYIEGYGTFQVCDRGGMADNVIDIYLGDPYECEQFGVRGADVYYG